jgi:bacterial/archaeal transporter family-2 protein
MMVFGFWLAVCAMVLSGMAVATQGPINARLGHVVGDPLVAAMASFAIGFALLLAVNLVRGALPEPSLALRDVPPWLWLGGLCGVWIVCAGVFSVPVIGALTALAALILGQMLAGIVIDAYGAFGLPQRPLAWNRVAAVLCVGLGLCLSRI